MDTKQWNAFVKESIDACNMSEVIQQTDNWFQQGLDYWKACSAVASSCAEPQTWLESAEGVSKTMESYMRDWTRIYGLGQDATTGETMAERMQMEQKYEAALEKMKKEKMALKRSLTRKEKTLKAKSDELIEHQNRIGEKEKELQALQTKVQAQAERLIFLEVAGKKETQPTVRPGKGATIPPAAK